MSMGTRSDARSRDDDAQERRHEVVAVETPATAAHQAACSVRSSDPDPAPPLDTRSISDAEPDSDSEPHRERSLDAAVTSATSTLPSVGPSNGRCSDDTCNCSSNSQRLARVEDKIDRLQVRLDEKIDRLDEKIDRLQDHIGGLFAQHFPPK